MLHKRRLPLGWGLSIALTLLALQCSWAQTQKLDTALNFNQAQKRIPIGIPVDGWYLVKASGAIGGGSSDGIFRGGYGARVGGYFFFKKGDTLYIHPGESGKMGKNVPGGAVGKEWVSGGGGGGATWVFKKATTNRLLVVAGGGGGAGYKEGTNINGAVSTGYSGIHGQITKGGADGGGGYVNKSGSPYSGTGGTNGMGGGGGDYYIYNLYYNGAGGAGYMAMGPLTATEIANRTFPTSFPLADRLSTAELPVALQPILVVTEVMEVEVRVALAITHFWAAHTAAVAAVAATAAASA